jgi:hypothetical protein
LSGDVIRERLGDLFERFEWDAAEPTDASDATPGGLG